REDYDHNLGFIDCIDYLLTVMFSRKYITRGHPTLYLR
ncbi:unnamed protein product, partial [marine sediment metagenome]